MTDSERIIQFSAPAGSTPEQIRRASEKAAMDEMEKDVTKMLKGAFGNNPNWTINF